MITGINHVQVTIPKGMENKAREFYCDILGLVEIEKPMPLRKNGGFWLQAGALQVHIGCEEHDSRRLTKAHVAYDVIDSQQLRTFLQKHHIEIIEGTPIDGFDRFDIRDPFGNRIEFMQRLVN